MHFSNQTDAGFAFIVNYVSSVGVTKDITSQGDVTRRQPCVLSNPLLSLSLSFLSDIVPFNINSRCKLCSAAHSEHL